MEILLINDDGIYRPGLLKLANVVQRLGRVVLVAPDHERSACGHGMTLRDPLRLKEVDVTGGFEAYEVNGLPTDCVNLALREFFPNGCDLLMSGINNGPNLGWDVTYSGTVAGAMEGAINGVPSYAISIAVFVEDSPIHYETAEQWLDENLEWLIGLKLPRYTFLNINVPNIAYLEIRGTRITRMGTRIYEDQIIRKVDPWGRLYYWQGGVIVMDEKEPGTDVHEVNEGFVSITPIKLDWTDHEAIVALKEELVKKQRGISKK
ncbi:MAG TPA: 5'/3'-nucleotidase SurE [Fimbriimonadales bacterium]|nr:5'/3'-nucleotidase SurE [Fimbriimonadales bacterium]